MTQCASKLKHTLSTFWQHDSLETEGLEHAHSTFPLQVRLATDLCWLLFAFLLVLISMPFSAMTRVYALPWLICAGCIRGHVAHKATFLPVRHFFSSSSELASGDWHGCFYRNRHTGALCDPPLRVWARDSGSTSLRLSRSGGASETHEHQSFSFSFFPRAIIFFRSCRVGVGILLFIRGMLCHFH